ncbi:hypothetical protein [Ferruginibacter sp. SUN106]|uniref:hypothetical protein n=1 Tax=Ferruginibacter sp. SUN106 TaxID=2978348 RepID=UPI003D367C86
MKFFIVTCLKEYQEEVVKIFKAATINAFSATDIIGFKDNQSPRLLEEWFASGEEKFDSTMLFSFTSAENAMLAMELIKKFNEANGTNFPIRAFVVPVERSIY